MWLFILKLIKNSVPQSYLPHFKCSIALCCLWLQYWRAQINSISITRKISTGQWWFKWSLMGERLITCFCLKYTSSSFFKDIFTECKILGWEAFYFFFFKILFIFRERGKEGGRGKETRCVRETSIGCLSHVPNQEAWPATKACSLTGNQTSDLSVHRLVLNPLSHTSQGSKLLSFHIADIISLSSD